jgi:hypothetical protein
MWFGGSAIRGHVRDCEPQGQRQCQPSLDIYICQGKVDIIRLVESELPVGKVTT